MLREISIQNYAVVESLRLELFPGLNLLSGETGSGKSILVDALGLALGGRASPEVIRTGEERAVVTAVFECGSGAREWIEELGLPAPGEGEVILRREIQTSGKSRLLINDQPVTLAAVRALAKRLVDVHGQNEHVALLSRESQLDLLDEFAGDEPLLEDVAKLFRQRRVLGREMDELGESEQERLRTLDLLRFQAKEIEAAHLSPGEDERLLAERELQLHSEKLREAATTAFANLYDDEGAACSRLAAVAKAVDEIARYDAAASAWREPLAASRATLDDLAAFLRDRLARLESDPQRLEQVEERLAVIDGLKRKYGRSIEEILNYFATASARLEALEHADERRARLAADLESAQQDYRRAALALSKRRREAASALKRKVHRELEQLGMGKTVFELDFAEARAGGVNGMDEIEMKVSPNPGEDARPLVRTASGGELSRLMLALKTVVAASRADQSHSGAARRTMIFDEVDAGIGGRVAECVGMRLKRLSVGAQVLCVTHLPQIACFADHHFYVEKSERSGRTVTNAYELKSARDRAAELARMLSGSRLTEAVMKHAAEMLKHAAESSAGG